MTVKRTKSILTLTAIVAGLVLLAVVLNAGMNRYTLSLYSSEALHDAVQSGNIDEVKELISLGASVNDLNQKGQAPLHLMALTPKEVRPDMLELLLDHGAKLGTLNERGNSPLGVAAYSHQRESMARLLDAGADPDARTGGGESLLAALSRSRQYQNEVEILRDAGATIGPWEATYLNDTDRLIELLEQRPADVNRPFTGGRTLLMVAVERGQERMVKVLLSLGADSNMQSDSLNTALLLLPQYGDPVRIVKLLLEHGAQPNMPNGWGHTPLHVAAERSAPETMTLLLEAGADPDARNRYQYLPIHSIRQSHFSVRGTVADDADACLRILLDAGSPVDALNDRSQTPLFMAARSASPETVRRMLELGADPTHRNLQGSTPLHAARADIVPILFKAGANVNATTDRGITPLHQAVTDRDPDRVEALLFHGADPTLAHVSERSALEIARDILRSNNDVVEYRRMVELLEAAAKKHGATTAPE